MFILVAGVLFLICSILIFAIGVPNAEYAYKQVLSVICAILFLILAGLCGLYWHLSRDTFPNFFLYDRARKKNISPEKLKFAMVNDRMTFLLTQLADSPDVLWKSDLLLREEDSFGYKSVYKPLVAYKMLFDLGEHDTDSGYWETFRSSPRENLVALCKALERAGEKKMAEAFLLILDKYPGDNYKAKEFLRKNLGYIRSKMVSYVKKYIELFY